MSWSTLKFSEKKNINNKIHICLNITSRSWNGTSENKPTFYPKKEKEKRGNQTYSICETYIQPVYWTANSCTWIDGFAVKRRDMPRPSNASLQVPSERLFQSPFDFPNSLVCILEDAVSKGCKVKSEIRTSKHWGLKLQSGLFCHWQHFLFLKFCNGLVIKNWTIFLLTAYGSGHCNWMCKITFRISGYGILSNSYYQYCHASFLLWLFLQVLFLILP